MANNREEALCEHLRQVRTELKPYRMQAVVLRWCANRDAFPQIGTLSKDWADNYDEETELMCSVGEE